jgi:cystinosin
MNMMRMPRNRTTVSGEEDSSLTPLLVDASDVVVVVVNEDVEDEHGGRSSGSHSSSHHQLVTVLLAPFADEGSDSVKSIAVGLSILVVAGSVLGLLLSTTDEGNKTTDNSWYHVLSACAGYTYFLMWSVSFYPQVLSNWKRRTTAGLSTDFCCLNVTGFACYAAYNLSMYYSTSIHKQYQARHGPDAAVTVQSNDVAFAVHALLLSGITLLQIGYYDGFRSQQKPSKFIMAAIAVILLSITLYPVAMSALGVGNSLDYLYLLSYVKMSVTLIKYMPQVLMNYRRKSTAGWSIWQILLDFSGGLLSDTQLVLDCWMQGDWSGITGNLAKFFLGFVSIFFDIIFMLQHYVFYPTRHYRTVVVVPGDHDAPQPHDDSDKRDDQAAIAANESMTV